MSVGNMENDGGQTVGFVSVLMSVYNDAPYLEQAVESILAQSYSHFEFIITDDCSTDGSREIIEAYAQRDDRIRVIYNEENLGLTQSLNQMLACARGDLIARMDADDIALPSRFEQQVDIFQHEPETDLVFSDTVLIDKKGKEVCRTWRPDEETVLKVLSNHCYIPHPTVMMRRQVIEAAGGYNEEYWTGQDKELWERLKAAGARFRYIPKVLLKYRINPSSVRDYASNNYWLKVANYCIWNRSKIGAMRYFGRIKLRHIPRLCLKMMIPSRLYFYRQVRA